MEKSHFVQNPQMKMISKKWILLTRPYLEGSVGFNPLINKFKEWVTS